MEPYFLAQIYAGFMLRPEIWVEKTYSTNLKLSKRYISNVWISDSLVLFIYFSNIGKLVVFHDVIVIDDFAGWIWRLRYWGIRTLLKKKKNRRWGDFFVWYSLLLMILRPSCEKAVTVEWLREVFPHRCIFLNLGFWKSLKCAYFWLLGLSSFKANVKKTMAPKQVISVIWSWLWLTFLLYFPLNCFTRKMWIFHYVEVKDIG